MRVQIYLSVVLCISMCGLGFGAQVFTSQDVIDAVRSSNTDAAFPFSSQSDFTSLFGKIKRWDISQDLVPVKFDTISVSRQAVVNDALNLLESSLGMALFDRTSLNGIAEGAISRGLVVSYGTSHFPDGTTIEQLQNGWYQAGVSGAPNDFSYPSAFLQPDGTISARLYINLGNAVITDPSVAVTAHEFAHALGLAAHFIGFGLEDPADEEVESDIDALAFAALSTLYRNDIGEDIVNITVYAAPEVGRTSLSFFGLVALLWLQTRSRSVGLGRVV